MSVLVPQNLAAPTSGDPRRLGRYLVIGRIGAGGTGTVYAAVDPRGGADPLAAVKALTSPVLADPAGREQLRARLSAVAAADGRVFVPPVQFDADAAPPWVAMPYVDGIPLAAFIRRRGALGPGRLMALAAGLAEGLQALHRLGVAHGDLKPDNVLIGSGGPRILDCALPGDEEHLVRTAGAWLSPERHGGAEPSPASDVFAWGAVTAFAATGRLPFGHGEPEELARRVLEEEPSLEGVPHSLAPLLERALSKDPGGRPSVRELLGAAIAAWEQESAAGAEDGGPPDAAEPRGTAVTRVLAREWQAVVAPTRLPRVIRVDDGTPARRGRRPLLIAGLAVALALLVGGAAVGLTLVGDEAEESAVPQEPSASPSPTGPRVETVRFDPAQQDNPVDGPWTFTVVERDPAAELPQGAQLSADTWNEYWVEAEGAEPETAVIPPGAEVLCASFCAPGPGHIDDGRGSYPVTGSDFTDYLVWGRPVIAEVEFAPPGSASAAAEPSADSGSAAAGGDGAGGGAAEPSGAPPDALRVVAITELFPEPAGQ
ncbi:hypothetical protein GCM10027440_34070 [Nocardiopsis coralliicola]